jgi:beta-xylosidase
MGEPDIWAPAVVQGRDGKFYMYTSTNHNIYAGVADHPRGPFRNLLGAEKIFIKNRQWWQKMHSIDADCFIDDDGQAYLYWGSGFDFKDGICAVGRLNSDMASFKEEPKLVTPEGYFEGPHMLKRNGIYYLMYSDGLYYDSTYKVRYATSKSPMGPFVQGKNSPILKSTSDGTISGPGHHFTFKHGNNYYIIYHRHVYPFYKGIRQIAIDKLEFEKDGSMKTVVATQTGVPLSFVKHKNTRKQLKPDTVLASSTINADYDAAKAFDNSNGTLWAARSNNVPVWVKADFGKPTPISSCELVFDQVMGDYEYAVDYSADNISWVSYATGNNASAKEWPVQHEKKVNARYLRITIKSNKGAERVGLWEVKVY